MPAGLTLKSRPFASNLSDLERNGTLEKYCSRREIAYDAIKGTVSLELFNSYALEFQRRFVPDLDERKVVSLDRVHEGFVLVLDDDDVLRASHVVMAVGISHFAQLPSELRHLPSRLATHSYAHSDLTGFKGRDVTVIGAGSSAVDISTLLSEAGARTSLVTRGEPPKFYPANPTDPQSYWRRIARPRAALGDGLSFRAYESCPNLFRFLPRPRRAELIRNVLGPASPSTMQARFEAGVATSTGETLIRASDEGERLRLVFQACDGARREVYTDHVIAATGYPIEISEIEFLSQDLRSSIETNVGMPILSPYFESSIRGLYFVGPASAESFGPLMRFVAGTEYTAYRLARELAKRVSRTWFGESTPEFLEHATSSDVLR